MRGGEFLTSDLLEKLWREFGALVIRESATAGLSEWLMDLLQGKLSAQVMEIITRRETGLFPRPAEIGLSCSCPDWAGMCKHVAATLYAVGARLDQDPELLFVLRGADHLELVTEATESVTIGVSSSLDGSATLTGENLAEIFGIEIEPEVPQAASSAVSNLPKASTPKKAAVAAESKGSKTASSRKAKVRPTGEAPRSGKRDREKRVGETACRQVGDREKRIGETAYRRVGDRGETDRRNGVSAGR